MFGSTGFAQENFHHIQNTKEPMQTGKFQPTWESLKQYKVPEWYRNAKFGIWAHWGPQCQPEDGDWYGRGMYEEGSRQYKSHLEKYGHPSKSGFKDVIHEEKRDAIIRLIKVHFINALFILSFDYIICY